MPDYTIDDMGSLVVFQPMNEAARVHLVDNTNADPWQWWGGGLVVDHNLADALIDALRDDGWEVE